MNQFRFLGTDKVREISFSDIDEPEAISMAGYLGADEGALRAASGRRRMAKAAQVDR